MISIDVTRPHPRNPLRRQRWQAGQERQERILQAALQGDRPRPRAPVSAPRVRAHPRHGHRVHDREGDGPHEGRVEGTPGGGPRHRRPRPSVRPVSHRSHGGRRRPLRERTRPNQDDNGCCSSLKGPVSNQSRGCVERAGIHKEGSCRYRSSQTIRRRYLLTSQDPQIIIPTSRDPLPTSRDLLPTSRDPLPTSRDLLPTSREY